MAQPLLRKTLSRLRGKERLGRKKAAQRKEPDHCLEPLDALESSIESEMGGPLPLDDGSRKGAAITVSRKQNWAKLTWGGQEDSHKKKLCQSSLGSPREPADLSEMVSSEALPHIGLVAAGPKEAAKSLISCTEICTSSISTKYSGQGAYLQSLERSSRHWVLSSGKAQGAEELAASSSTEPKDSDMLCSSEGEIWYNPIPEDEDLQPRHAKSKEFQSKKGKPRETEGAHEGAPLGSLQQAGGNGLWISLSQARPAKHVGELNSHQHQACGEG